MISTVKIMIDDTEYFVSINEGMLSGTKSLKEAKSKIFTSIINKLEMTLTQSQEDWVKARLYDGLGGEDG
jgi:hypothetical protein